ncbi:MAG: HypC/HybG/HupF family hydrogenase formation chaperone [Eubacterium sp.]|nr:HypC/HybG/HupF family hydrogenase formation chaperone [Eubacterium sp.]
MCVAAPGKVIEINGDTAVIDYNGNKVNANKGIVDIKIGDYVLVHAGLIIQVLPEDEAKNMLELFEELSEL